MSLLAPHFHRPNGSRSVRLAILACALLTSSVPAEIRDFTSSDGRVIKAEMVSVSGETATLKLANGKSVPVPIDRFSEADQIFIKKWHEENKHKVPESLKDKRPRVDIKFYSGRSSRKGDNISGYVDEQKHQFKPAIVMQSRDAVYPIYDAKLTILVTGTSPETGDDVIVYKKVIEEIHLPLSEELRFEGDKFELWYDDEGAMYGFKFKGYHAILEDPDGKVLVDSHTPSTAAKYVKNLQTLEAGDVYDKEYKKTDTARLSGSVKMK